MQAMKWMWNGEAMQPANRRSTDLANQHLVVGMEYRLKPHDDRTKQSHDHFFACVTEAWNTLPEHMADRFPSPDHLRKYALIKSGHCDMRTFVASSKREAERIAAFIRPDDEYALVSVSGPVVSVHTAHSQSMKDMGKATFQKSKDDVFRVIGELIGADPADLGRAA